MGFAIIKSESLVDVIITWTLLSLNLISRVNTFSFKQHLYNMLTICIFEMLAIAKKKSLFTILSLLHPGELHLLCFQWRVPKLGRSISGTAKLDQVMVEIGPIICTRVFHKLSIINTHFFVPRGSYLYYWQPVKHIHRS